MMVFDENSRPAISTGIQITKLDSASSDKHYIISRASAGDLKVSSTIQTLMTLMDGTRTVSTVATQLSNKNNKIYRPDEIIDIINRFLVPHGLLEITKGELPNGGKRRQSLNFSVDFLPPGIVNHLTKYLGKIFSLPIYPVLSISILIIIYLWPQVMRTDMGQLVSSGWRGFAVFLLLSLAALWHELGHASACSYYDIPHGDIGFGFYLVFPVFYIDVNDAWRLVRKQRAMIDFGGIYFHLLFAIILFIYYLITASQTILVTIIIIYATVLVNLNPVFKYDGYWLLSDICGIPNLRMRAYDTMRDGWNKIFNRNRIFNYELSQIRGKTKILLIIYAMASNLALLYFFCRIFALISEQFVIFPCTFLQYYRQIMQGVRTDNTGLVLIGVAKMMATLTTAVLVVVMLIKRVKKNFNFIGKRT